MSSEIHINPSSFGKPSETADALVIELSAVGVDFCELNNELNQPLYVVHQDIDVNSPVSNTEQVMSALKYFRLSQKSYKTVYVNFFTELFTLCPATFYEPEHARRLLEFNAGKTDDMIILNDDITPDIKLIYAMDEQLKSTLNQVFPHHKIKHSLSVLSQLMLQAEELAKDQVLLTIHKEYIELIIKQEGKLLLANQFAVKAQEDILYYVLFALEQYQLNPSAVSVCITGNADSNSEVILTLKKYIKHIRLAAGHKAINWQAVEGMPQHFYYSLLNRPFCEL